MFIEFLLIQFFGLNVEAYYLQNFAPPASSNDEGWLIKYPYNGASTHTSDCGGNTIFGGFLIFGCQTSPQTSLMKYFSLPPHYKVRIDINFWKFNKVGIFAWYFTDNTGSNQCGGSGTDYSTPQYNDFPQHTLNSIIVELYSDCDNTNFWGLTNFQITLNECYLGCLFCFDSTVDCIMWKLWQSFFQLKYLDNGLEGWIKNKFPSFSDIITDVQQKVLILHQSDSAITYLTLPDHSSLIIQFRVQYYTALPIIVRVYIDGEHQSGIMSSKKNVVFRTPIIQNTKNGIKLEIYCQDGTVGIREVQIILRGPINLISCLDDNLVPFDGCFAKQVSCLEGCVFCVKGECLMCDTRWDYNSVNQTCESLCGDKYITANEQCDDGNQIPFDGCHQCKFSCPLNCQNCTFGKCQTCNSGYYYSNGICNRNYDNLLILSLSYVDYNQQPNYFVEIDVAVCGDGKIQEDEECDDGNNFSNDGCYNCYFQCILGCQKCIFDKCLQCIPTYELINGKCYEKQTQFKSLSCNRLDPVVSDNLIQELSQFTCCDSADTQYYKICDLERSRIKYNNLIIEHRCPLYCELCQIGQCKQCLANYFLLKNQCVSQITKGVLLFQDGIHISQTDIGCYKCKDSCQIQCLQCVDSYCLLCIDGWSLMNGICKYICGDNQIAIWSIEQCDTNLDYCLDCQFVCRENCQFCINFQDCLVCTLPYIIVNSECQLPCISGCKKCINGICYDNCPNGQMNIEGLCYSICGDGIIQQNEQCDDGNDIQFDGCFKCQYSCPLYCENCFEGICYECQQFFKLIQNTCYDDCGSGIKSYDEQCDDGNLIDEDGCTSNCQIEIDYKCQEKAYSFSDCQFAESPYMLVRFLNQTYDKCYIEISFSQAIFFKHNYDFESLFKFSIDETSDDDYQIKLDSNFEPVINQILNFQFQVQIQLFVSTNSSLTYLNIFLINEAYNSNEMEILNPLEKISLKKYSKLSQSDLEKTKQLTQYQEAMIMAQGIGSVIVLMSGNFQIFVEILDNLQYQSNLKYINVIYPENLYLFFEATNLISIVPIFDYLQINGFYQRFLYQDFIESYAKLQFYKVNTHLITNLQFFFIQVIFTFIFVMVLRLISKLSFRIVYRIQSQHYLIFKLRSIQSKLLIQIFNWIFNFFHYILTSLAEFYQNGLLDILLANAWDLLFKIFLSLTSSSKLDIISRIQNILSYLALAVSVSFITSSLKPDFSRKNQMLINRYRAVYLLKQFLFCYFLICFQNHQLIQILMLTTTNVIYLIALIFARLNLHTLDKLQMIIMEISIITFTFSSIFYLEDYRDLISEQNKMLLGFAQIYLLISGLLGIFIKQLIMIYKQIKKRCFKIKKRSKISKLVTHLIFEVVS